MRLRVRNDVILVLLPPLMEQAGIQLVEAAPSPPTHGLVRQVGPNVQDIQPGDCIAFPTTVGDEITLDGFAHLLLRETDVSAVLSKAVSA